MHITLHNPKNHTHMTDIHRQDALCIDHNDKYTLSLTWYTHIILHNLYSHKHGMIDILRQGGCALTTHNERGRKAAQSGGVSPGRQRAISAVFPAADATWRRVGERAAFAVSVGASAARWQCGWCVTWPRKHAGQGHTLLPPPVPPHSSLVAHFEAGREQEGERGWRLAMALWWRERTARISSTGRP